MGFSSGKTLHTLLPRQGCSSLQNECGVWVVVYLSYVIGQKLPVLVAADNLLAMNSMDWHRSNAHSFKSGFSSV